MTVQVEGAVGLNMVVGEPASALLRLEIDAVLADWAWHVDHGEIDELVELFTEDARFEPQPGVELHGRPRIRQRYASRSGPRTTRHVYSGLRLAVVGPVWVRATSTWVTYAANQPAPVPDATTYQVADFHDLFTRGMDRRWRICDRTIVSVFRDPTRGPVSG
jgi:3-phenylpropionate/cinnamic acid dioxygenase small subunit